MMGFSAGGAITFLTATRFAHAVTNASDPIDGQSSRPDFAVLAYGGGRAAAGSEPLKDIPPIFMVAAADDPLVKSWTADTYDALVKAGVPVEIHVYLHGGHGFALRDVVMNGPHLGVGGYPVFTWNQRFWEWLEDVQMVPRGPMPSRR
jgi:dienelactone hydrolase